MKHSKNRSVLINLIVIYWVRKTYRRPRLSKKERQQRNSANMLFNKIKTAVRGFIWGFLMNENKKKRPTLCIMHWKRYFQSPALRCLPSLSRSFGCDSKKQQQQQRHNHVSSEVGKKKSSVSTPDAEIYLQLLHTPEKHGCAATLHRLGDICPTCMATPSWSFWLRFKLCLLSASPRKRRLASRRWPSPRSPHQHGG